jgi:hypothetical protein
MSSTSSSSSSEKTARTEEEKQLVASTRRFDLRRILGGLFVIYGLIVGIIGVVNFQSDLDRTNGIAINLWTGGAMLVLGILFFVWDFARPVPEEDILTSREEEDKERAEGEAR